MRKLEKFKYFALGMVATLILSTTVVPAIAASVSKQFTAYFNDIKIVIDGETITPKDANGTVVEPFIVSGTTYLPVRAVSEALGKAVYWDGPTYTVYIGSMSGNLEQPTLRLKDAQNIGQKFVEQKTNVDDNYGNTYSDACAMINSQPPEYLLNMKYSSFKGTFFIPSGTSYNTTFSFRIEADGNIIYTSPILDKTSAPTKFNVNVTGYNNIKIIATSEWTTTAGSVWLGNAGFYQ